MQCNNIKINIMIKTNNQKNITIYQKIKYIINNYNNPELVYKKTNNSSNLNIIKITELLQNYHLKS